MYKHEILLTRASLLTAASDGAVPHQQPTNFTHAGSWARRARFTVAVYAVEGAPTAWSLSAKAQDVIMHDGNLWRYQKRRWFDLPDHDLGTIADEATSLTSPKIVVHDVEAFGSDVRLNLVPSFTGGTSPGLRVSITRELWS